MKKVIVFILFGILFFLSVLLYIIYDSKGYYYGIGCGFCNENMPYGLTPKINFDYPQNFVLLNEDGFELTGGGFRYKKSSFKIKKFLSYGYNDTSIIAKCTDSLDNVKYLVSYETGNKSEKGNPAISFKDIDNSQHIQIKESYQWVDVDEEKANATRVMKFIFLVGAIFSILFIVRKFIKSKHSKATALPREDKDKKGN